MTKTSDSFSLSIGYDWDRFFHFMFISFIETGKKKNQKTKTYIKQHRHSVHVIANEHSNQTDCCHLTCWPPVVPLPSLCYLDYARCPCLLMAAHHPSDKWLPVQASPSTTHRGWSAETESHGGQRAISPAEALPHPACQAAGQSLRGRIAPPLVSDSHKSNSPFQGGEEHKEVGFVFLEAQRPPPHPPCSAAARVAGVLIGLLVRRWDRRVSGSCCLSAADQQSSLVLVCPPNTRSLGCRSCGVC